VDVAVLPPFPLLVVVRSVLSIEDPFVMCGGQDLSPHDKGAHTGDVSGPMLCSVGCRYVVVGHSERRTDHAEDDALVQAKVAAALRHGLTPILCVGEGLDVREAGRQVEHTLAQLDAALDGVSEDDAPGVVVAYEPVWAIGTGKVATPDDAQEVCGAIRGRVRALYDDAVADRVRVLYGGSVNAKNVAELMTQPDVDGALVGGASLDADGFAALCKNAA
jgi:triosephosphate isomerase